MSILPPDPDGNKDRPEWKCSWCRAHSPLSSESCDSCDSRRPISASTELFTRWIVSLDDDDPTSQGRVDRRTVTLRQIVERARRALGDS